jgi:prolyl oligopeptidase
MKEKNKLTDKYSWLEKDSEKVSLWANKNSKPTKKYFSALNRDKYLKRYKELLNTESELLPSIRGNRYFFRKKLVGEDESSIYFKVGLNGTHIKLLDPKKLRFGVIQEWNVSKNGSYIQVSFSKEANDRCVLKVFDVEHRKFIKDTIESERYPSFQAWNVDSTGFWYARGEKGHILSDEKYFKKIYYHKIGQDAGSDVLYFDIDLKKDDWPMIARSSDGVYELVNIHHKDDTSTIYFRNNSWNDKNFIKITNKKKAHSFAKAEGGYIYMITDDKAPNDKILRRAISNSSLGKWETFVPERGHKLESWILQKDYLVLEYMENVVSKLYFLNLRTGKISEYKLPSIGSLDGFSTQYGVDKLFYRFSSLDAPISTYLINLNDLSQKLYWRSGTKIKAKLEIKQEWSKSKDGTKIPMFIMKKAGTKGLSPTIVYSYGGFGISSNPSFRSSVIPFIENGGTFVIANIRGGGEFGKNWHESSIKNKFHKKSEDLASVLKYLSDNKYSSPNKLALWGGSNGGLVVSVMCLRYPQLFKAALIDVPVTDMLRFHLFHGGRWWIHDYGDPDDKKMRKYLLSYSPYHNVEDKEYPSILLMTGRHDDRVHPMHTYKFFAKLKENKSRKNPILLRIEENAGHSGAGKIKPAIEKFSDMMVFLDKELSE